MTLEPEYFTRHASVRKQQRCVPDVGIWALRQFGAQEAAGQGCWRYSFDKAGWKRAQSFFGNWPLKSMDRLRDLYLVVTSQDQIVTLAYRE